VTAVRGALIGDAVRVLDELARRFAALRRTAGGGGGVRPTLRRAAAALTAGAGVDLGRAVGGAFRLTSLDFDGKIGGNTPVISPTPAPAAHTRPTHTATVFVPSAAAPPPAAAAPPPKPKRCRSESVAFCAPENRPASFPANACPAAARPSSGTMMSAPQRPSSEVRRRCQATWHSGQPVRCSATAANSRRAASAGAAPA